MEKKPRKKPKPYRLVLSSGDKSYESEGETIVEAIQELRPDLIKTRAIISVEKEGKTSSVRLYPARVHRLLVNKTYQIILSKGLNATLQ